MRLYCMRHGEAEPGVIDQERRLTSYGEEQVHRLGQYLNRLNAHVSQIMHSGIVRAEQTAKIMADCFSIRMEPKVMPGLGGGSLVEPMAEQIDFWEDDTLLVSHLPFISDLVSHLVTGQMHLNLLNYAPSTLVILERTKPGVWRFSSIIAPTMVPSW